ncbi:MAG: hypothetical protein WC015_05375 [Methanoregula sp.]|jgi:hypothetical protein
MPEIVIHCTEHADSITIGTPGKGGEIKIYFDSGDLNEAKKRIDAVVLVRQHLLNRLASGDRRA